MPFASKAVPANEILSVRSDRLAPKISDPYDLFVAASAEVRRHYQWIVLHEFLPTIADAGTV
jgi:hypothetical protein